MQALMSHGRDAITSGITVRQWELALPGDEAMGAGTTVREWEFSQ